MIGMDPAMLAAAHLSAVNRCVDELVEENERLRRAPAAERTDREFRVRTYCEALMRNERMYPENEIEQYRAAVARYVVRILDGEKGA